MSRRSKLATAEDSRGNASEERTYNHRECDPKDQLGHQGNLQVRWPEAFLGKSWRQGVVMSAPVATDGEKHDDGHRNACGIPVGSKTLNRAGQAGNWRAAAATITSSPITTLPGNWIW